MSIQGNIEVSNTTFFEDLTDALEEDIDATLEAVGSYVSGGAAMRAPVDTGLLRNSLTYAIAGEPPAKSTYKADRANEKGEIKTSSYNGSTTKVSGEKAVYIGTNVEYAAYQELGTSKTKKQPFLKPTIENDLSQIEKMIKAGIKGELTE
jgi:HK97 gp10 family phage protein